MASMHHSLGRIGRTLARPAWLWPAALALCAALPLFDRINALTLLGWAGVTALALAWARRAPQPGAAPTGVDAPAPSAAFAPLLDGVVPVWRSHLESVRGQTEQAINELIASFESIKRECEAAGFVGTGQPQAAGEQTTFNLLTLCERQLHPVVTSMKCILDGKVSLVDCVNELATAIQELQGMAQDVSQIASHTNILAINAAIEAAHAGESGRGFAIIAKAIRELSQTSADAGRRISDRMSQIEKIMLNTVQTANEASQNDNEAIELSGNVVHDVLTHVRALGTMAETMRERGMVIRRDTDNLLLNLQFQDRTSQMLGAIDWDLQRLQAAAAGADPSVPEPEDWLAEFSKRYTMDDQREATAATAAPAAPAAAVEFF